MHQASRPEWAFIAHAAAHGNISLLDIFGTDEYSGCGLIVASAPVTSRYSRRPPLFQVLASKLSALAEMRTNRAASTALPGSAPSSAMLSSMVSFAAGASVRLAHNLHHFLPTVSCHVVNTGRAEVDLPQLDGSAKIQAGQGPCGTDAE